MVDAVIDRVSVSWETSTLNDLCVRGGGGVQTGPFGSQLHASDYVHRGVPSVMPINIGDNRIVEAGIARIREEDAERLARHRLRVGDIVYSRRGDVERRALVREPEMGWLCGTGCLRIRPGRCVDSEWLSYYLGHPAVRAWIVRHAVGATMPNLNTSVLAALPVSAPSLSEQRAIAEVLGALDDKIEVNTQIASRALQLGVAQYEVAVDDSARSLALGSAGRWLSGGTPRTDDETFWGGSIPWISATSLKTFFVATSERTVTEEGARAGTRLVPRGTLLFVVRGMSLKQEFRVGVAQREVAFGQDCKAILLSKNVRPTTVAIGLLAKRHDVLGLVDEAGHGTGRLPTDRIASLEIPLPSEGGADDVEATLSALVSAGAAAAEESRRLAGIRDALLPLLMSGELRVRDAEPVGDLM